MNSDIAEAIVLGDPVLAELCKTPDGLHDLHAGVDYAAQLVPRAIHDGYLSALDLVSLNLTADRYSAVFERAAIAAVDHLSSQPENGGMA
jgi:hypothetical protein